MSRLMEMQTAVRNILNEITPELFLYYTYITIVTYKQRQKMNHRDF